MEHALPGADNDLIRPVLDANDKAFQPTLKTKIDLEGNSASRWNIIGEAASVPYTWRGLKVKPRLHFSHLWIMGAQFGVVLKVTDAELTGEGVEEHVIVTNPFR